MLTGIYCFNQTFILKVPQINFNFKIEMISWDIPHLMTCIYLSIDYVFCVIYIFLHFSSSLARRMTVQTTLQNHTVASQSILNYGRSANT